LKIICISAKARSGKDTTANILKEQLTQKGKRVLIAHYADLVKYVAKTFFNWNGDKDNYGRTLLQLIGTNDVRAVFPNFWVDFIIDILTVYKDKWDYVLIPDCRFPNEYESCKKAGFDTMLLRIVRPNFDNGLTNEQQKHSSETALDDFHFDYIINNDGDINILKDKISMFIKEAVDE
jgi:hypothetical protein